MSRCTSTINRSLASDLLRLKSNQRLNLIADFLWEAGFAGSQMFLPSSLTLLVEVGLCPRFSTVRQTFSGLRANAGDRGRTISLLRC